MLCHLLTRLRGGMGARSPSEGGFVKILRLRAENILRLKAVDISPDGELVVVGGANNAGKSSCLDSIEMALSGERATPAQPVRRGERSGKVVLDLGDLVVTRTFSAAGGRKLVVANKDGAQFPSPQALLDKLYSSLSFDPLAFERQPARLQAETLRALVGLDTADLDAQRQRLYDERAEANKAVRALEVTLDALGPRDEVPAAEVSVTSLLLELAEAERLAQAAAGGAQAVRDVQRRRESAADRRQAVEVEQESLRRRLRDLEEAWDEATAELGERDAQIAVADLRASELAAAVPDTATIRDRIRGAEALNARAQRARQRASAEETLDAARGESRKLSDAIIGVDAARQTRLAAAAFPVAGLGVDEEGVTLDGLPFAQASTSDRIRVSVAIGLASHPTLKVLLVRDGSLLGEEKLALLATMAQAAGAQVWLELLQEAPDGRTTVYIEDGSVRPRTKPQAGAV